MIHTWTWNYTLFAIILLLSLFLLLGMLLLWRSRHGKQECSRLSRYQATPESVSTPQGHMSYRQVNPQVSLDEGVRRAEHTSYFPRVERKS